MNKKKTRDNWSVGHPILFSFFLDLFIFYCNCILSSFVIILITFNPIPFQTYVKYLHSYVYLEPRTMNCTDTLTRNQRVSSFASNFIDDSSFISLFRYDLCCFYFGFLCLFVFSDEKRLLGLSDEILTERAVECSAKFADHTS